MFTAIDRTGHLAGGVADVIHVWRGVSLPVCAENANNVRCLGWRESITLTVSHLCPLGRKGARLGAETQKEKKGRKSEGKGRLARTFRKSMCACGADAWWSSDTADTCHLGFSAVKLN